jgi:cyclophilin family peptidyl-prolyl cis-trans isomerase
VGRHQYLKGFALALLLAMTLVACGEEETFEDPTPTNVAATEAAPAGAAAAPTETVKEGTEPMQWTTPPEMQLEQGKDYRATIHTSMGDIVVDLFETETPITVNNFVFLAQQGFYTNVPFHRIMKGFMIQTGDPTGTGAGGPGYRFEDEPVQRDYVKGTLAMANAGPNTNGSQFFITHADAGLPKNYTIFGEVTEGMDVVDAIASVPVSASARGEPSVPNEPVTLESVEITVQ